MEQTECSETLAYKFQTPGDYPEESIQHFISFLRPKMVPIQSTNKTITDTAFTEMYFIYLTCSEVDSNFKKFTLSKISQKA